MAKDVRYGYTKQDGETNVYLMELGDTIKTIGSKTVITLCRDGALVETLTCTQKQVRQEILNIYTQKFETHVYRVSRHGYINEEGEYLS